MSKIKAKPNIYFQHDVVVIETNKAKLGEKIRKEIFYVLKLLI